MPVPIFLHVDLIPRGSIRMRAVDGVGAGSVEKNTARSTMILLQGSSVRMPRIFMGVVVAKRRGLPWRAIVEEDIVAIVQRDGRGLVASLTAGRFAYRRSLRLPQVASLTTSCTAPRKP